MQRIKNNIIPILLFLVVFGVYLYTAPPGATNYADSNELITASYILGVPHPPGYPLFVLIGKMFSFIPFGTVAYRYAIMAGFFGALTVVVVYKIILKLLTKEDYKEGVSSNLAGFIKGKDPRLFALIGALSLAFSYLFWIYSYIPEAFAFNNFFTALLIYLGICWYYFSKEKGKTQNAKGENAENSESRLKRRWGRNYYPILIALTAGFAFWAHQIIVLLAPALIYLIWITDRPLLKPSGRWTKVFGALAIGLIIPALYFPITTAVHDPVIDFGNVENARELWELASREYYAKTSPDGNAYLQTELRLEQRLSSAVYYVGRLASYFTWPVLVLGVFGLGYLGYIASRGRLRHIYHFLGLAFIFSGLLFAMYATADPETFDATYNTEAVQQRMYLMGMVVLSVFIGIGARELYKLIKRANLEFGYSALLLALLPAYMFMANFDHANKHNYHLGEDYIDNLFVNMEPNAIFITHGDMPSFAAYYKKYAKEERQDVTIVPLSMPHWQLPTLKEEDPELWDTDTQVLALVVRDIIEENMGRRPIYFTGLPGEFIRMYGLAENPYVLSPRGLVQKATEKFEPMEEPGLWSDMSWRHSDKADDYVDGFDKEIIEQYVIGHFNSFAWYLRYGYNDLAKKEYDMLMEKDPHHRIAGNAEGLWKNSSQSTQRNIKELSRTKEEIEKETLELIENGDTNGAIGNLIYLAELDPQHVDYRLYLANLYGQRGWIDDAEKEVNKVLEIDPGNDTALKLMRYIQNLKNQN